MASIEQIAPYNTWAIRHKVLYPDQPFDLVRLEEDETGMHFGLFDNNKLVTVISTFRKGDEMQFRKFATLPEYQGKGYGTSMMNYIMNFAREEDLSRVWCSARVTAETFYARFGFSRMGEHFSKNGIDYVIMEHCISNSSGH
ncbi:MAG TPA: GNAT family N-acetyltransferase [Sphingobacteriaceae bacterium]